MPPLAELSRQPRLLLVVAALLLYVGARAGTEALRVRQPAGGIGPAQQARRLAWANWMPIAAVALFAAARGEPSTSLAIVLASSVACLSLVAGSTLIQQVPRSAAPTRSPAGMLLPAVCLLLLLAGVRGQLTIFHAVALVVMGLTVVMLGPAGDVSTDPRPPTSRGAAARGLTALADQPRATDPRLLAAEDFSNQQPATRTAGGSKPTVGGVRGLQFALAVIIAVAGGVLAIFAASQAAQASSWASPALVAALLVGPVLVLSLLGTSSDLALRGRTAMALDAQRRVVLLNLCVLLPLVIVEAHAGVLARGWDLLTSARSASHAVAVVVPVPTTDPAVLVTPWAAPPSAIAPTKAPPATAPVPADDEEPAPPKIAMPFPLGLWRVDAVALTLLSFFIWPAAQARWAQTRGEGFGLILAYAGYLLLTLFTQFDVGSVWDVLKLLFHVPGHAG